MEPFATPTEIYDRPANTFVAGFIGTPAMNLLEGVMEGGTFLRREHRDRRSGGAGGAGDAGLPGRGRADAAAGRGVGRDRRAALFAGVAGRRGHGYGARWLP
jgi:multiple sugar transport system ATP-binding protein